MLGCANFVGVAAGCGFFYSVVTVRGHSESAYCFYSQEAEDSERNDDDFYNHGCDHGPGRGRGFGFGCYDGRDVAASEGEDSGRDDNLRPRQRTDDGSGGQFEPVPVSR